MFCKDQNGMPLFLWDAQFIHFKRMAKPGIQTESRLTRHYTYFGYLGPYDEN